MLSFRKSGKCFILIFFNSMNCFFEKQNPTKRGAFQFGYLMYQYSRLEDQTISGFWVMMIFIHFLGFACWMLGKSDKYSPKWWFNGNLPWYNALKKSPTKQIQGIHLPLHFILQVYDLKLYLKLWKINWPKNLEVPCVPGSKLVVLGMVIPPLIGILLMGI